jgi:hypothetical protein
MYADPNPAPKQRTNEVNQKKHQIYYLILENITSKMLPTVPAPQ